MANVRGFLTIDGVSGASTDPAHRNSIELLAWGWQTASSVRLIGSNDERPPQIPLFILTEDAHAALQLVRAEVGGIKFKAARLDVVSSEFRGSHYDFKGVTIVHSTSRPPIRTVTVHQATLCYEAVTPFFTGPPASSARPEHTGLIHEARYSRSRPGGK
jgi:hypothetical protein